MSVRITNLIRLTLFLFAALGAAAASADERPRAPTPAAPPQYAEECGACHIAYPGRLLPAESWRRLMQNLSNHFGTDASLDADAAEKISAWLAANAAGGRRAREAPPEDRITRSAWFVREHDEAPAGVWRRPAVKSPANCPACHTRAAQGDYSERHIRIPR